MRLQNESAAIRLIIRYHCNDIAGLYYPAMDRRNIAITLTIAD